MHPKVRNQQEDPVRGQKRDRAPKACSGKYFNYFKGREGLGSVYYERVDRQEVNRRLRVEHTLKVRDWIKMIELQLKCRAGSKFRVPT